LRTIVRGNDRCGDGRSGGHRLGADRPGSSRSWSCGDRKRLWACCGIRPNTKPSRVAATGILTR